MLRMSYIRFSLFVVKQKRALNFRRYIEAQTASNAYKE